MDSKQPDSHISDELLSEYALGRLSVQQVPAVFQHLLVCDECNERYEDELFFKNSIREVLEQSVSEPARKRTWFEAFAMPKPAWAAVAALALAIIVVPNLRQGSESIQVLALTAVRGTQNATADSGHPVELHLGTTALYVSAPVTVQVIDASGHEVWRGGAKVAGQTCQVRPEMTFRSGRYWVRVLDPRRPDPPLREYSFDVR